MLCRGRRLRRPVSRAVWLTAKKEARSCRASLLGLIEFDLVHLCGLLPVVFLPLVATSHFCSVHLCGLLPSSMELLTHLLCFCSVHLCGLLQGAGVGDDQSEVFCSVHLCGLLRQGCTKIRADLRSIMRSNCTNAQLHIKSGKKIAVAPSVDLRYAHSVMRTPRAMHGHWMFTHTMAGTDLPPLDDSVFGFVWFCGYTGRDAHLIFAL